MVPARNEQFADGEGTMAVVVVSQLEKGLNQIPKPIAYYYGDNGCHHAEQTLCDKSDSIFEAGRVDDGDAFF